MTDTFSKFGYSFQIKLIAALFKDRLFLQQICDILKPEFMESEDKQWLIKTIVEYFDEYSSLPTLEVMKVKLDNVDNDVLTLFWQFTIQTLGELDIVSNQHLSIEMFLLRLIHLKGLTMTKTDYDSARTAMVDCQVRPADVTHYHIIESMLKIPREEFFPERLKSVAYAGVNIEIGVGRYALEPRLIGKMLNLINIREDELVLDVGSGFGSNIPFYLKIKNEN